MNKKQKLILFGIAAVLLITAASVQPQLSLDEQSAIVDAVVKTMNPEAMKATVIAEVEADLVRKFQAAGYIGVAAALTVPGEAAESPVLPQSPTLTPTPASLPDLMVSPENAQKTPEGTADTEKSHDYEGNSDAFYDGAVMQEDGSYRGLHAKFANSYAYTVGEGENGVYREFHTEYEPNVRFNVDVIFENDGSLVWPPRIEMRHVGNVGEYTGHTESVVSDRTNDPVLPGERCGFTISAHGSENLGWTTFYFQLYDADSGTVIEGGQGSFTYNAK